MTMKSTPLLLTCLIFAGTHTSHALAEEWQFKIEPYLMFTSIDGDATIGTIDAPLAVDFNTILDNLDSGLMLRFEAFHQSNWGIMVDWAYMDLSKSHETPRGGIVDAGVRQAVLEVSAAYKQYSPSVGHWTNYVGIRRWDNTYELGLTPGFLPQTASVDRDQDWVDIILGFSMDKQFSEQWHFTSAADVGGFGLAAKLTGSVKLGISYDLTKNWDLSMQYKGTYVDYHDGDKGSKEYFSYDTITHGPIFSASYSF